MAGQFDLAENFLNHFKSGSFLKMVFSICCSTLFADFLGVQEVSWILWDQPHKVNPVARRHAERWLTVKKCRSMTWSQEARHNVEKRRLARTVTAQEGVERPRCKVERHSLQGALFSVVEREIRCRERTPLGNRSHSGTFAVFE